MPFLSEWRARRNLRRRAAAYVRGLLADPGVADVDWLATAGTGGDVDHARWELRYARRAIGLIVAQRDALDDQTASAVARELAEALGRDPNVGPGKLRVAERQLNARIRAYADAVANREGAGSGWHLGRTLLTFAGRKEDAPSDVVARAGDLISRYLTDANSALREQFGVAALPENVAPSAVRSAAP
jgi:hypothetical protein